MFRRAIVRPPAANFADGLTTVDLGAPDVARALAQHEAYCRALERCGLALTRLAGRPAPSRFDLRRGHRRALPARRDPDAAGRAEPRGRGRRTSREALGAVLSRALGRIEAPGTLDGGDICEAGRPLVHRRLAAHQRTKAARQLARFLAAGGPDLGVRRHPRRPRHPAPEERDRLALGTAARRHRLPRRRPGVSPAGTSSGSTRPRTTPPTACASTTLCSSRRASRASSAGWPISGYRPLALDMSEFAEDGRRPELPLPEVLTPAR